MGKDSIQKFPMSQRETQKGKRRASLLQPAGTLNDQGPGPCTCHRTTEFRGAGEERGELSLDQKARSRISWKQLKPNSCHLLISKDSQFFCTESQQRIHFKGWGDACPLLSSSPPSPQAGGPPAFLDKEGSESTAQGVPTLVGFQTEVSPFLGLLGSPGP